VTRRTEALRGAGMSEAGSTVPVMADIRTAAVALAALELLPAEPWDLSPLLSDSALRSALVERASAPGSDGLLSYLCAELDHGRVETWEKRLNELTADRAGTPVLAGDPDYPPLLAGCWDRPPVLFLRGCLAPDRSRTPLALVGSRQTAPETLAATTSVAASAAAAGISIISGLAAGVDTAAHTAALEAGGHTVAVLGTGIRRVFPEQNNTLAERIAASGALLSQFAPDSPRTKTTFLRRNNVIAGLAATSLVMDGQERSGSRHQAEQAVRYGRTVLLWAPALAAQAWAQDFVASGHAAFVDTPDAVLAACGAQMAGAVR
jgi:DNA processing protein